MIRIATSSAPCIRRRTTNLSIAHLIGGPSAGRHFHFRFTISNMNWLERTYPISINTGFDGKKVVASNAYSDGFTSIDASIDELLEAVGAGYAWSAQFAGSRKTSNFTRTGVIGVDIDAGLSVDAAQTHPFVAAYGSAIYTTASHSEEAPRFRILFALERPITSADDARAVQTALAEKLGGDPVTVDPARMWYGNQNAEVFQIGSGIPDAVLEGLISEGRKKLASRAKSATTATTSSDIHQLFMDTVVQCASGDTMALADCPTHTSLYCPFHQDANPSAFVVASKNGAFKGIFCSTCKLTIWAKPFDFASFEKSVRVAQADPSVVRERHPALSRAVIEIVDERYLSPIDFTGRTTFVCSEKGTGKTEIMHPYLDARPHANFLIIGHRVALMRDTSKRLPGVSLYLDQVSEEAKNRYAVCLDSLGKIDARRPIDLVIIDESEQVLGHFGATTMHDKVDKVLPKFEHIITTAGAVVCLDADLGWNTFDRICELRPQTVPHVVLNTHLPAKGRKHIRMINNVKQIQGEALQALSLGQRIFVTSSSLGTATKLYHKAAEANPGKKLLLVTSETTKNPEVRAFLEDPSGQALLYQAIFASPVLGTGIDLTFKDESDQFDIVFGIFDADTLSHTGMDQAISRARQTTDIRVYVTPVPKFLPISLDEVTDTLAKEHPFFRSGYDVDGNVQLKPNLKKDLLWRICSTAKVFRNASLNALRTNFIDHVRRKGYAVQTADEDEETIALGALAKSHKSDYSKRLLAAPELSASEFDLLEWRSENGDPLSDDERRSFARATMERFYQAPISEDLIKLDEMGRYRQKVRRFEWLTDPAKLQLEMGMWDHQNWQMAKVTKTSGFQNRLIYELLTTSGLYADGRFFDDVFVSIGSLDAFGKTQKRFAIEIQEQFGSWPQEGDLIKALKRVLRLVGLNLGKEVVDQSGGHKKRSYGLDETVLLNMKSLVERRSKAGCN